MILRYLEGNWAEETVSWPGKRREARRFPALRDSDQLTSPI
jgi:hypothetical protein